MRCIFCKTESTSSRAVEHIIPESMGNTNHVLPVGAVCDWCNQYFARKVERQVLESPTFRLIRASMEVQSKRGRVPQWEPSDGTSKPDYRLMGRFLAKVGLEVLSFKTLDVDGWNDEVVDKVELDELRNYARFNIGSDWPFTTRTLHPVNAQFVEDDQTFHLLHEFDILLTSRSEAFLVLSLFGVELGINLGGRSLEGYREWLEGHRYGSPLYAGKNA
ncbi:HNH endonuclease [Methyloversatilis discipulorum]|uniref:HNH endonuclease n=1 Tax=Methyloversatilis discipulorum TaxID=1119528 RepID=UPI00035DB491|nr:HNH endonuclease [Methyloversatilis discipulorum]